MVSNIKNKIQEVLTENSRMILTGVGVVGTVSTAVLTGKATMKASKIIHRESLHVTPDDADTIGNDFTGLPDFSFTDKVKMVWPQYIPAAGVGGLTILAILYAHRLNAKEVAALATAYGLSEKKFEEYRDKVTEKLGMMKEEEVREQIAQDRVDANPVDNRTVIITGTGDVLCYDVLTDRYFNSTIEKIKEAQNEVNFKITNRDEVSLSEFYEEIGLNTTPYSDTVGWNIDNTCEVEIATVMSKDNQPCISVDFKRWPKADYTKVWP